MTMRNLMWAALATGLLSAGSGAALANDTVRLGGPAAQSAISGGTDIELVRGGYRGGHGGGHGGGYHGGGHGYRGGYGYHGGGYGYRGGYYGGRGYYGGYGYYAGYRGYGYGRGYGYYAPYYYSSYYYPSYYPSYYYTPTYYYSPCYDSAAYSYPIAGSVAPATQTNLYYQAPSPNKQVPPMPLPNDGTYQYNGGPGSPIPMPPPGDMNPTSKPGGNVPLDGRLVSLPTQMTGGTSQVGAVSRTQTATPRISYPAYGDEPIVPAPRKR